MSILQAVVSGQAPYIPLGRLGFALREVYDFEVNEAAIAEVAAQLEQIRAAQPAPQAAPMPGGIDQATLDSLIAAQSAGEPAPDAAAPAAPPAGET